MALLPCLAGKSHHYGEALRILITGGAGYLGSVVTCALLRDGHTVRCLDRDSVRASLLSERNHHSGTKCEVVVGDIRNENEVLNALRGVDAVLHLAAIVGFPSCDAQPLAAQSINVAGTRMVVKSTPAGVRLVFLSTCSVYGRTLEGICRESDEASPLTLYGRTKLAAEQVVLDHGGVVLRAATAYGPSPSFRMDLIVHSFIKDAITKGHLNLFEPGALRPFIHVDDASRALLFGLEHFEHMRGRKYNIGSVDATLSKLELARQIAQLVGSTITIDESGSDPDGRQYRIAFDEIESLGFQAGKAFGDGLKDTVNHVRNILKVTF